MKHLMISAFAVSVFLLAGCNENTVVSKEDLLVIPAELMEDCPALVQIEGKTFADANDYILYLEDHDKNCMILDSQKTKFIKRIFEQKKKG